MGCAVEEELVDLAHPITCIYKQLINKKLINEHNVQT